MPNLPDGVASKQTMPKPPMIRFDTFAFDMQTCELFQDGGEVSLELQPAKVLRRLIESAGQTVTRQELMDAVWGTGTNVCFDDNLNYCVRQLRRALDDDPRSPQFIATLPRRGYRFVAPLVSPSVPTPVGLRRQAVLWSAMAASVVIAIVAIEFGPNNHHEWALLAVRSLHDMLF